MADPEPPSETPERPNRWLVSLDGVTLLGRYRVERKIGGGGMANVYLAYDEQLEQPVVVKIPHPALLAEDGFRERFDRETRDLVSLQHPHIVSILARGEHEDLPFLVMQYLKGGSLGDRMRKAQGQPLPYAEVKGWVRDISRALDAIHAQGVVHRDIKPDNVLFDEYGNAYLSDFGIAKAVGGADTGLTVTGATPGSPAYMAPEQPRTSTLTGQSDQYSLAATIYEALSGRPAFEGETVVDVLIKKQSEDPVSISQLVPTLPPSVNLALTRALSRSPEDRFDNCQEMAAVLLGEAGAVEVRPAGTTQRAAPPPPPPTVITRPAPPLPTDPARAAAFDGAEFEDDEFDGTPAKGCTWSAAVWILVLGAIGGSLLLVGLLMVMLSGASDDMDLEPDPEASHDAAVAALSEDEAKLVGTYEIDVDELIKRIKSTPKATGAERRMGNRKTPRRPRRLEDMLRSGLELTLQADRRFRLDNDGGANGPLQIEGRWHKDDNAIVCKPDPRPAREGDPRAGEVFHALITETGLGIVRRGMSLPMRRKP